MLFITNETYPQCNEIYPEPSINSTIVTLQLSLIFIGIVSNLCLLMQFSGRAKLGTASFTYIRIIAIVQFVFFIVPYPLKILTMHYQRGQTWIATNFLPVIIGLFHFAITSLCLCFACRLQLLLCYVRVCFFEELLFWRSRRWNSLAWVAWRKIFWILPLGVILNMPLCFEYNLDYDFCVIGLAVLCCVCFIVSERCLLPQFGSPYATKHSPLLANLRPILLALITSQSVIHKPNTFCAISKCSIDDMMKLILYGFAYSLPFPLMVLMSTTSRSHLFHILSKSVHSRPKQTHNESAFGKMTKHIRRAVAYSKLEMENSEIDIRSYNIRPHNLQAILKEDAIYRVRFAMQRVGVIQEEEENCSDQHVDKSCSDADDDDDDCGSDASVTRAFIESAQFLEQPIFINETSNNGYAEHVL